MVDSKAEEDDDEGFGDFTFASSFPTSDQINGRKPTTLSDDDDWGDFVESHLRSDPSTEVFNSQSSKPSGPFGFSSDQSQSTRADSEKTQWVKPRGALPLSLFGDLEQEEEESDVVDPPFKDSAVDIRNGTNMVAAVHVRISDLYSKVERIEAENGFNSDSNGSDPNVIGENPILNGSSSLGMDSILDLFAGSNHIQTPPIDTGSGVSLNTDLFSGSSNLQSPQANSVSGVSPNVGFFAGNNDIQSPQIDTVSGVSQNTDLFSGSNNPECQQIKAENGGFSPKMDFFAGNDDIQSPQINTVSGVSQKTDLFSGSNNPQSQQIKAENGGFSPKMDFFAGNDDIQSPQTDTVSGISQNIDLFSGSNNPQSQQIKAVNGLNTHSDLFGEEQIKGVSGLNSNSSGMNANTDLFSGSIGFDAISNIFSQVQLNNFETSNGLSSDLSTSSPVLTGIDSYSDPLVGNEEFDGDYDGWEFKDAYSEPKAGVGSDKVDGEDEGNFGVTGLSFEFGNGSHGADLFSSSNGFSIQPREVDVSFDFKPLTVAQNGFNSDPFSKSEQNGTQNGLKFDCVVEIVESDESFGDFEGAFTGLNQEGNRTASSNNKGALPLSIFGDEELETDDSPNVQDAFTFKPSCPRNGNISIDDLILNLYSKSQQSPPVDNTEKHTGNGLHSSDEVMDLSLVNSDDDFEDASWDFKEASIQKSTIDEISIRTQGDTCDDFATNLKMINFVEFYCKLKNELSVVCKVHLNNLMRAKHAAALSGEDAKAAAIDKEIKDACKELHEENIYSKECSEDELQRDVSLKEFIEVSNLKFQVLESEYGLSGRLHLAEEDLGSAVELMKHATSMLDVLTVGSTEDQGIYVSTWSKMISVCAQELKHGAWVWKQCVEKNIQREMLSEPRGKGFILALGEIYRVAAVLGASTKLHKPWILLSSRDFTSIKAHLEECYTLWSTSGIEEAFQDVSDPIGFEYHGTVEALRESIRFIHDHDELTLGNRILNQQVSVCQLSLLTSEAVPDIKMVLWNGKYCFLPLANLWANLISCDPPELP